MGAKLSNKGIKFDGYSDTAMTLLARDYKGFGNQQMIGVIEWDAEREQANTTERPK